VDERTRCAGSSNHQLPPPLPRDAPAGVAATSPPPPPSLARRCGASPPAAGRPRRRPSWAVVHPWDRGRPSGGVTPDAMAHPSLATLLSQFQSTDRDYRFMAASDLLNEL